MDDDDGRDLPAVTCSGGIKLPPLTGGVNTESETG